MAHFARIENGIVTNVIVAEQDYINTLPGYWIQTSYNTVKGIHRLGGIPLRKNYAGIGYTYDTLRDAFIPPKPFPSWVFNEETCSWDAPVAKPEGVYIWNEELQQWELPLFN